MIRITVKSSINSFIRQSLNVVSISFTEFTPWHAYLHEPACPVHGGPQKLAPFLYALTLPNIDRFSQLFHCQNFAKVCSNTISKDPTTPQVCRYTTLWYVSVLKATIENKTTSVTTHLKKLTTQETTCLLSQLLSKVTVTSCSFCIKCSMLLAAGRHTQAGDATDQWCQFLGHPVYLYCSLYLVVFVDNSWLLQGSVEWQQWHAPAVAGWGAWNRRGNGTGQLVRSSDDDHTPSCRPPTHSTLSMLHWLIQRVPRLARTWNNRTRVQVPFHSYF